MKISCLVVCLMLMVLSGCATRWVIFGHAVGNDGTRNSPWSVSAAPSAAEARRISAVKLIFTQSAQQALATQPRFTAEGLSNAIETELRARNLLEPRSAGTDDTVAVVIDEVAVRSTSNAVLFGYVLLAATLGGNLEILAADGHEVRRAPIRIRAQLLKPAGEEQVVSLEPLYQGFAGKVARNLTGTAEPVAVNH